MRIPKGPLKGTLLLLVVAGLLVLGLLAIQGRLNPPKPAPNTVAFVSERSGYPDLWLMNIDGSGLRQLTSNAHAEASPSWSSDATMLVYTAERSNLMQLFSIRALGKSRQQQLTVGTGTKSHPVFSPDGSRIAFISQGRVYVMSADGAYIEPTLPGEHGGVSGEIDMSPYKEVDWSPDGVSLAAVQRIQDIDVPQLLPKLDDKPQVITDVAGRTVTGTKVSLKWATSGHRIAVSTLGGNRGVIVVIDYDEKTSFIATGKPFVPGRMAWSPSGSKIAFETLKYREGEGYSHTGLAITDLDTGNNSVIVKGEVSGPSWSSDGELILFTKTEKNGQRNVWSVKPDGSDARNLTNGFGGYDAASAPPGAK